MPTDYRIGRLKGRFVITWRDDAGTRRRYRLDALTAKDAEAEAIDVIRRDPAVLAALPEVQALIAAAYEAAAQTGATQGDSSATEALGQRICCSGHMCGCQGATVEDWLLHLIRALTPADATAALAARDAAMIARGMREAAGIDWASGRDVSDTAPNYLSDWQRGLVAGQNAMRDAILVRAAEIERDATNGG